MAQIYKRSGKWAARIQWVESASGKRLSKSKSGFSTKTLAKQWAVSQEAELNNGTNIAKSITFPDYFDMWLKTYKKPKLAYATLHRYQITQKVIQHEFAGVNIKSINRQRYQKFVNKFGATHAPSSVVKMNALIRAVVNSAILDDYLTKDFTKKVTIVSNPNKTIKVDYLNLDEIHKLIKATLRGITLHRYTSRYMILTAIYTGM